MSSHPTSTVTAPASRQRRWPRVLGVVIGLLLIVAGAIGVVGSFTGSENFQSDYVAAGDLRAIAVSTGAGSIEIHPIKGDEIEIQVSTRSSFFGTAVAHQTISGSTLELTGTCSRQFLSMCQTEFELGVPEAMLFELDLSTSAGAIQVVGDFVDVHARTTAGNIDVELTEVPVKVALQTTAGDIDLVVPHAPYDVDASTKAGDIGIEVDQSRDSDHEIRATTTAGDISVRTP